MRKVKECFISFRIKIFRTCDILIDWMKQYWALFLINLVIGCIVFFMLISQNLVNSYDGVWYNFSFYAGTWERSIGRWFWPFLDKVRFGIVSISLNSFVTLIMISVGNVLLVDLFKIKHKLPAVLSGALFIIAPVVCDSLSYCYMSVTFGLAYLFGVFSAYCALKIPRKAIAVVVGGFFIACSMGNYQAYFGVTCIILLIYFIKRLFEDADIKTVGDTIFRAIVTAGLGGLLYEFIVTAINAIYHVELASYKGAGSISLRSIIVNLPQRIPEAYKEFFDFYFANNIQRLNFHLKWIYIAAFLVIIFVLLCKIIDISRRNFLNGILCVLAILIVPLACNATIIITTTTNSLLMTGGTAILFSLSLCLFDEFMDRKLLYLGYLCILTGMLWVNICIVNNDQIALREGQMSTVTIAQNIITRLADEGYINSDSDNIFAFVGRPSGSSMFIRTGVYNNANDYAKFGNWWTGSGNNRRSWDGVFQGYCGVKFNFCSDDQYDELIANEEIQDMPCFPDERSINEINGITVIKVSDSY